METFGDRIRRLRTQRGWKANELARRLGITPAYLSQMESDRAIPSELLARGLAGVFGQDEDDLVFAARRGPRQIEEVLQEFPRSAMAYLSRTGRTGGLTQRGACKPMVRLLGREVEGLSHLPHLGTGQSTGDAEPAPKAAASQTLPDVFDAVRPSIVAFASRLTSTPVGGMPLFPPIIGTGFVVDSDGIVVTNRHVIDVLQKLPPHPVTKARSDVAILWRQPEPAGDGLVMPVLFVDIKAYSTITSFSTAGPYYGEDLPDIGFVQLMVRDVPALQLATGPNVLRQGLDVATAGFPLGTDPLVCYGKISQLTPMLRRGVVSSLLPFPCPHPHGFTVDVVSQGGCSGSPVFLTNSPSVVGMAHAVLIEAPNVTLAIPSGLIKDALNACTNGESLDLAGVPTLDSLLKASPRSADLRWDSFLLRKRSDAEGG